MNGAARNRLVNVQVTVANLEVEATIRVGADPRLIVDRCPLAAEIRQRHEIARLTLLALGKA